jgi:hypothetical protein
MRHALWIPSDDKSEEAFGATLSMFPQYLNTGQNSLAPKVPLAATVVSGPLGVTAHLPAPRSGDRATDREAHPLGSPGSVSAWWLHKHRCRGRLSYFMQLESRELGVVGVSSLLKAECRLVSAHFALQIW